jgi:predicted amidophosphoribosyltransferase
MQGQENMSTDGQEARRKDSMDNEQPPQPSAQSQQESALLKLQQEFHQLLQECRDCRREIAPHWQFCAHCGVRLATHCPGCGNPLPPAGAAACPRCGLALPSVASLSQGDRTD